MNVTKPEKILSLTFFADSMLGKLARWLRMLGYDTAYFRDLEDEVLIELVLHENRWLLTRDRYLAKRKVLRGRHTLHTSDYLPEQLVQLHRELHIALVVDEDTTCRCPECNHILEPTTVKDVHQLVPMYIARHHTKFKWCPCCSRVYWPGTHWAHFLDQLEQLRDD
jgi:uncharacterized protein with PIN domain